MGCLSTNGGIRPFAGAISWPDVGPGAKVSAASFANPTSVCASADPRKQTTSRDSSARRKTVRIFTATLFAMTPYRTVLTASLRAHHISVSHADADAVASTAGPFATYLSATLPEQVPAAMQRRAGGAPLSARLSPIATSCDTNAWQACLARIELSRRHDARIRHARWIRFASWPSCFVCQRFAASPLSCSILRSGSTTSATSRLPSR